MFIDPNLIRLNLKALAESYTYDEASFAPLYERLTAKVAAFPLFGDTLACHLGSVSHHTEKFMKTLGYSDDVARKVGHAAALHDIGKIKQDPDLWRVTERKRNFTDEQKTERPKHARLGLTVLDETMAEIGMVPSADQKAHFKLVKHLMQYHHERLDGSGPERMPASAQDDILRLFAVIDTVDGKFKAKGLTEIFEDMSGAKHAGQFDPTFVEAYAAYYAKASGTPTRRLSASVLANQP